MPDQIQAQLIHISSIIVRVDETDVAGVAQRIAALPGLEVVHAEGTSIIALVEAPDARAAGDRMAEIASLDGVHAANMVFEHAESAESLEEPL